MDPTGPLPPHLILHDLSLGSEVQFVHCLQLIKALRPVLCDLGPLFLYAPHLCVFRIRELKNFCTSLPIVLNVVKFQTKLILSSAPFYSVLKFWCENIVKISQPLNLQNVKYLARPLEKSLFIQFRICYLMYY